MSANLTPCFWCCEVGSVRMYIQDHIQGIVSDYRIRVRADIIKELFNLFHSVFSWFILAVCNSVEGV